MATLGSTSATQPFLLNGKWVSEGKAAEIRSPYDGSVIAQVVRSTPAHLEEAVKAAVEAFEKTRKLPSCERQRALLAVRQYMLERREEFAQTICSEAGKPIKTARAEVDRALFTLQIAAEESTRIYGEYLPLDLQEFTAGRWALVRRFPLGPVAAITPFNFPLNLVCHKLAPAMAAGCSVVLKPASQTPLSSLLLARAVEASGWPAGGLNVLYLSGAEAEALVSDERMKLLSFTGSAEVGWELKARLARSGWRWSWAATPAASCTPTPISAYAAARCVVGGFSLRRAELHLGAAHLRAEERL